VNSLPRRSVLLALCAMGVRAAAQDGGAANPLSGTWKLDSEASTDLAPLLERYHANFIIRRFASAVAPTNEIRFGAGQMTIDVHAATVHKQSTLVFDGKTLTTEDLFGTPYEYSSVLEDGVVVSRGKVKRAEGEPDELLMRRFVAPGGTMVLQMTITPKDGKPLEVKRVFKRAEK
jgi:hypothetical protein